MATLGIRVCSLDVGQGMSTFVEIYDTNGQLIRTLLFDLGYTKAQNPATMDFLVRQINLRKPQPYIDGIFVSHKDRDHINLLDELLTRLPGVGIGMVRYGGRRSWYTQSSGYNVINVMAARCADPAKDVSGFPVGETDYDEELGFWGDIWDMDDVTVYLLAVNTPYGKEEVGAPEDDISKKPDGDQANSKSLICYLWYNGSGFTISGDATFPSIVYINKVLGKTKLPSTKMVLLPHHGSRKTTFGLSATNAAISDTARASVTTFARKMGGKTVIASANTKHSHPSLETTALFQQYSDTGTPWWEDPALENGKHYMTTYQDIDLGVGGPKKDAYRSLQTTWNVYSTLYKHPDISVNFSYPPLATYAPPDPPPLIPAGMNWLYTLGNNGLLVFRGVASERLIETSAEAFTTFAAKETIPETAPPPLPGPVTRTAPRPVRPALAVVGSNPLARLRIRR